MTNVINPEIQLVVENIFDNTWDSAQEDNRLDMEIDITKDLDGKPNIAHISIYNMNDTTIALLSSGSSSIEIRFNILGQSDTISCFLGEIMEVYTESLHPGTCTHVIAESQRYYSRDKYLDVSYEATTALELVVNDLTEAIGLPVQSVTIPQESFTKALHLTGPAFLNLREVLQFVGLFPYICDGVLYISNVFEPPDQSESNGGTTVSITSNMMTSVPRPTVRQDVTDLWYTTSLNDDRAAEAADMFAANKAKVKKLTKKQVRDLNKELIEVDAVSTDIRGIDVEVFGLPSLQPDTMIQLEGDDHYYRVQKLTHQGDNHEGVYTSIQADLYGE